MFFNKHIEIKNMVSYKIHKISSKVMRNIYDFILIYKRKNTINYYFFFNKQTYNWSINNVFDLTKNNELLFLL